MMGPIVHCRMCLRKVDKVLELRPTPIANAFAPEPDTYALRHPLGLCQCPGCGHVQVSYNIDGSELFTGYRYETPEAERPRLKEYAQKLAQKYPDALATREGDTQSTQESPAVLEIGCNNGMFCDELREAGFNPIGMDPSSKRWGGLPKWFSSKSAKNIANSMGQMKLIVSNNTFAHVDDLRNVFLGIKYLLAPDGHLVFEVQYLPKLVDGGMFDMIYHEHKDYHTFKPWPDFLAKFGLCVTEFEYLPTHGGSIRLHVGFGEKGVALPEDTTMNFEAFKARIDAGRNAMRNKLNTIGKVVAFGATAKACTLIHQFDIADRIAYCVDETLAKQGLYIPGTSIEISAPERMEKEPASAVLITAWNYADILRPRFDCEVIVPFKQAA